MECLLSPDVLLKFPGIDSDTHRRFVESYGESAFVCRFVHCSFSTAGFATLKQRDQHESQHRRKYCCPQPTCFSSTGFTSNAQLKRHNDKYHPVITNEMSLTDAIKALAIEDRRAPSSRRLRLSPATLPFPKPQLGLKRRKGTENLSQYNAESQNPIGGLSMADQPPNSVETPLEASSDSLLSLNWRHHVVPPWPPRSSAIPDPDDSVEHFKGQQAIRPPGTSEPFALPDDFVGYLFGGQQADQPPNNAQESWHASDKDKNDESLPDVFASESYNRGMRSGSLNQQQQMELMQSLEYPGRDLSHEQSSAISIQLPGNDMKDSDFGGYQPVLYQPQNNISTVGPLKFEPKHVKARFFANRFSSSLSSVKYYATRTYPFT